MHLRGLRNAQRFEKCTVAHMYRLPAHQASITASIARLVITELCACPCCGTSIHKVYSHYIIICSSDLEHHCCKCTPAWLWQVPLHAGYVAWQVHCVSQARRADCLHKLLCASIGRLDTGSTLFIGTDSKVIWLHDLQQSIVNQRLDDELVADLCLAIKVPVYTKQWHVLVLWLPRG